MRRLRSIRVQLLLSHLGLVVIMAIVMSSAIGRFFGLGRSIDQELQGTFSAILLGQKMKESLVKQERAFSALLAGGSRAQAGFDQSWQEFVDAQDALEADAHNGLLERAQTVQAEADAYHRLARDLFAKPPNQVRAIYQSEIAPALAKLNLDIESIQRFNQKAIQEANARAKMRAERAALSSIWQLGIALILAVLLAVRMIRVALTPLEEVADQAEAIGSGDLDHRISVRRNDEIGALARSLNAMADSLSEMRAREVRRLKRAEQMSDAALEHLYDPVIVSDAQGRLVYLNRAAEGLFGPTPATPRMPIIEHIGDRRIVRAIHNAIQDRVSAGEDSTTLIPLQVQDAERFYRLRASPMKDGQGQLLGSVTVLEDITHMRELDRMKTEFIGVASHELRTPVTSMLLGVQLLEEGAAGPLTPEQAEIVRAQRDDLERLESLMKELLDMTRLEAGSLPPRFEIVAPQDLLKDAHDLTAPVAEDKGIALVVEANENLPVVRADRSQIARVLTNLISNAIRHTPAGGRIRLRAIHGSNQVTFSVGDTGSGIPKDYLEHIFDRFVQVPGATGGGAGLGLSISRTIVQAHGGEMGVESEIGHGATFRFTLPTEAHRADHEEMN